MAEPRQSVVQLMSDNKTEPVSNYDEDVHVNHWCESSRCKRWGSFGYDRGRGRMEWFCNEHGPENDRAR